MNERIDIYWFSGTGNTLAVAREMADVFIEAGKTVRLLPMEVTNPAGIDPTAAIGLAVPVACQTTYPLCWDFINGLPKAEGTECFFVDSVAHASGGILGPVRDVIEAKGFTPIGAKEIIMSSNFLMPTKGEEKISKINAAGEDAARRFARDLLAGNGAWRENSLSQKFAYKTGRMGLAWRLARWLANVRIVAEKCTGCGLCRRLCPAGAITIKDNVAQLDRKTCQVCLRCAGLCPAGAISLRIPKHPYKNATPADFAPSEEN